ncbi:MULTISPECIES: M57 family metalloprotease [Sphingobacterium]|uniref:Dual-action HEIGH metallo-peptidase n=1 Tax=Sphingobacterium multivorum TaxID=28454 RepID=A0ABX7CIL0_SPHMU|nr:MULTISPECIES: M57 family metalloprotease [Sphingobacterium]QQT32163.1 hypothetical protein I6I99_06230 [Sphingobacterium multivorum]QQT51917.1 hypothetical protein I6I98_16730 [Sphingobacterium multivorum]QRY56973.1 hypothetical protein JVX97_23710 [Sphingobacterium siyangense]
MKKLNQLTVAFRRMLTISFLIPILLTSCKKEQSPIADDASHSKNDEVYSTLLKKGISPTMIQDLGGYYLVENDLLVKKQGTDLIALKSFLDPADNSSEAVSSKTKASNPKKAQTRTPNLIFSSNSGVILYKVDADYTWNSAIQKAVTNWSQISNTTVNFFPVMDGTPTDNWIIFMNDGGILPNNVIAAAEFPSNGEVGFRVRINLDFNNNQQVSESGKIYNMVHEIGHCLGFRHTNWQQMNENQDGASLITGTPQQDGSSVMNGGTALNLWNGFSQYDILATQTIYPYSSLDKWITYPEQKLYYDISSNTVRYAHIALYNDDKVGVNWNPNLVNTGAINVYLYQNKKMVKMVGSNIPNLGTYSFDLPNNLYTAGGHNFYNLQIKIESVSNQNLSDMTSFFSVMVD